MPRYYFESFDHNQGFAEEDGSEHRSDREAGEEAIGTLTHLARDKLPGGNQREFVAEVLDENGKIVFHGTLSFRGKWLR